MDTNPIDPVAEASPLSIHEGNEIFTHDRFMRWSSWKTSLQMNNSVSQDHRISLVYPTTDDQEPQLRRILLRNKPSRWWHTRCLYFVKIYSLLEWDKGKTFELKIYPRATQCGPRLAFPVKHINPGQQSGRPEPHVQTLGRQESATCRFSCSARAVKRLSRRSNGFSSESVSSSSSRYSARSLRYVLRRRSNSLGLRWG